jgi:hypothetical protein
MRRLVLTRADAFQLGVCVIPALGGIALAILQRVQLRVNHLLRKPRTAFSVSFCRPSPSGLLFSMLRRCNAAYQPLGWKSPEPLLCC